jgi:uncharacterized protein with NRDE domain
MICGLDLVAGGTWLGINQHRLMVAVTNRTWPPPRGTSSSRGVLCRDLLSHTNAADAARECARQLTAGPYAGANFVCLDPTAGYLVANSDEVRIVELLPGLHVLTNGSLDDPTDRRVALASGLFEAEPISSVAGFVELAQRVCRYRPDSPASPSIVLHGPTHGTVSSTILALTSDSSQAEYRYAPGPPDQTAYDDYSLPLRQVLRAGN